MSAVVVHHPDRPHLPLRPVAAGVAGLVAIVASVLAIGGATEPTGIRATSAAAPPSSSSAAIGAWVDEQGEGAYAGECHDGVTGICSSLVEDLGDVQIHVVGPYATDLGTDVLLRSTSDGWEVAGVSPWPQPGDRYDGAPWSPTTAITAWWADGDRAALQYGATMPHVADCADAAEVDAPVLCSTLVEEDGARRTYDSGRAGAPADVRIVLEENADRTWSVVDTLAR